jgi:UDP-2,3-diacylglucosamine hydrolase
MAALRKICFISDLHLQESQPVIVDQFMNFLQSCYGSVDELYILGDLFEVWIGDDENTPFQRKINGALKSLSATIPIYFMHGNRDYLIGKKFLQSAGMQLLEEEKKISIFGRDVLLMHGDTLCTQDIPYLKMRKTIRHPLTQKLFLSLPLIFRKKIANKIRDKSMQYTRQTASHIMDVTQAEVERVMQKHEVSYLIHGHTHKPACHSFAMNHTPAQRIVLGAWHEHISVLEWDELGNFQLINPSDTVNPKDSMAYS